jgi:hypothetical protein
MKQHYIAPEAEWIEALNALVFLADSNDGSLSDLEDSGLTITW